MVHECCCERFFPFLFFFPFPPGSQDFLKREKWFFSHIPFNWTKKREKIERVTERKERYVLMLIHILAKWKQNISHTKNYIANFTCEHCMRAELCFDFNKFPNFPWHFHSRYKNFCSQKRPFPKSDEFILRSDRKYAKFNLQIQWKIDENHNFSLNAAWLWYEQLNIARR